MGHGYPNTKHTSIGNAIKGFWQQRHNRVAIVSTTLLLVGTYIYYISTNKVNLLPNNKGYQFVLYTDSVVNGHSQISRSNISDSLIDFNYILKEGFLSPYVGLSITANNNAPMDLRCCNQICLEMECPGTESLGISLFTPNPNQQGTATAPEICYHSYINVSPQRKQYRLNIDQFKIPDWWCDRYHISPNDMPHPDMRNILHLNIGTAYTPQLGIERTLKIHAITFGRNNTTLGWTLLGIQLAIIALLCLLHYLRNTLTRPKSAPVTITYKPVDVENPRHDTIDFLDYINNHFHNTDLALEQVAHSTGTGQRRIAAAIQEAYGCNFKSYVNQLRINESKRLLNQSELSMGEIAFKVGFNNQSHFNRVFKSMEGMSPSEYLARQTR